jgi:tRNA dimethylallyltransferase
LPILAGGTGLYLQSIIDGFRLFPKQPDLDKRRELEAKSVSELYHLLEKIKPVFAPLN